MAYYSGTTYVSFFQNRFGKCQYLLPTIQTTREGISLSIRADIRDILHRSRDIHLHSKDIHLHNRDIRHLNRYAQHHWKDIQILSRYTVDIYGPYGRNTASTAGIPTSTAGILTSHSWHIQTPRQLIRYQYLTAEISTPHSRDIYTPQQRYLHPTAEVSTPHSRDIHNPKQRYPHSKAETTVYTSSEGPVPMSTSVARIATL